MRPSKIIFKHGDNSVVPELSQEYQFGIYFLTKPGKETGKNFRSAQEASKAGLDMTDIFELNGKKTTLGRIAVNKVIPNKYRGERTFDPKTLESLLEKIAKESPQDFDSVMNGLKDLGKQYAHERSSTISLDDLKFDRSYRDNIVKDYAKKVNQTDDKQEKIKLWTEAQNKVQDAQKEQLQGKNNIYDWLESGGLSGGKAENVLQILSMPGVVQDIHGKPIEQPILKSYAEGLDSGDYWNSMYGTRKGMVDTSVSTQEPGALSKALMGNVWDTIITEEDCGTDDGITYTVNQEEKDILDRCLAQSIPGIARKNAVVDDDLLNKIKEAGIQKVKVRSPLTCEATKGICQKCYGVLANGNFPNLGYNVGIADSQALTERATQLILRTKHTGAAVSQEAGSVVRGFGRFKQLLEVPKKVPGKAILSPMTGTIESIKKDALGGYNITINGKEVQIPAKRKIQIRRGQRVEKGDRLTDGAIKPQELSELKGHRAAQQQMIEELDNIYENDFNKKTFETVLRAIGNNAEITEIPDQQMPEIDKGYVRGDKTTIQEIEQINNKRQEQGLAPIGYKPYFKSISILPQDQEDWMGRVSTNRIKQALQESALKGAASNVHGINPLPAYIYGNEFGRDQDEEDKQFY